MVTREITLYGTPKPSDRSSVDFIPRSLVPFLVRDYFRARSLKLDSFFFKFARASEMLARRIRISRHEESCSVSRLTALQYLPLAFSIAPSDFLPFAVPTLNDLVLAL